MSTIWLQRPPAAPKVNESLVVGSHVEAVGPFANAGKYWLVAFIRHVGCPFAERTVKALNAWGKKHPQVKLFLVSHGDPGITQQWLAEIGGIGAMELVNDPQRTLYGAWGLGYSSLWHFAGPSSLLGVARLWQQGIHNRVASGTRWQRAGTFLMASNRLIWQHVPTSAQQFQLPPTTLLPSDDVVQSTPAA